MGAKIKSLHIENVKRVQAVHLEPNLAGLTIIGGKNGQGKTSVLDSIAWALGGGRQEPSRPKRDGSMSNPEIRLTLSNGLVVERKGKNSTLTVTDVQGRRGGQQLLDAFVSQFALDLPKFLNASTKEKAEILLKILGVGDKLQQLELDEKRIYNERHAIGQIADSKRKFADELPEYADAPREQISVSELIQSQQAILARNGENQRKRDQLSSLTLELNGCTQEITQLEAMLANLRTKQASITADIETAQKSSTDLHDESTAEIEASLANIEAINAQVAANQQKAAALDEAEQYRGQYEEKTAAIEGIRTERLALLDGANMPLPGLSVQRQEIYYNGQPWDCMASSEQLRVAVAIVRRLQPDCSFALMDKLEQMDMDTLAEFNEWLQNEGLQIIATRVSTGGECSIIIEDGLPQGMSYADVITGVPAQATTKTATETNVMEW